MTKEKPTYKKERTQTTTSLHDGTQFEGELHFDSSLKINGRFKGKIVSRGFLYIGEDAEVIGDVSVDSILIGGYVKGTIEARDYVEMLPTGKIFGDIKTNKLKIADGVIFEGKCEMTN